MIFGAVCLLTFGIGIGLDLSLLISRSAIVQKAAGAAFDVKDQKFAH